MPSHGFPAVIDKDSKLLILGSFPSVKSRKDTFYYMHPQNRFWDVLRILYEDQNFLSPEIHVKKQTLKTHHIALYDVIESCDIIGSKDNSITNVRPADISSLIEGTNINKILLNGTKAETLFKQYNPELVPIAIGVPSTSPANAQYSLTRLVQAWKHALNLKPSL
ncbi:MAG: DNA-deoxyinosine glycosylase [Bacillota bacterium]